MLVTSLVAEAEDRMNLAVEIGPLGPDNREQMVAWVQACGAARRRSRICC